MGTTQSKAGTTLLQTHCVHRMPSTDKTRADSVVSTMVGKQDALRGCTLSQRWAQPWPSRR
eukprot:2767331-Prymnesium_polylepis.1